MLKLMDAEKPYFDSDISLNSLAESLDESANYASQVINDTHKRIFFAFINSYRIEEMTELMKEPANSKLM